MPALILNSGPDAGKRFELAAEMIVGRGEVDCVIDDAELSRRHVAIRVTPAGVEVEDLGSLNGTWYKGKRLDGPTVLPAGAVIRLGETELQLEAEAPADTSKTRAAKVVEPGAPAPPPAAAEPEPEPEPAAPPPTNIPLKAPSPTAKSPDLPAADPDEASTVPPRRAKRPAPEPPADAAPAPAAPPRGRRPAPSRDSGAPQGAFRNPTKPGRRKVATRLVLPAFMTFVTIFATAIALLVYFATR